MNKDLLNKDIQNIIYVNLYQKFADNEISVPHLPSKCETTESKKFEIMLSTTHYTLRTYVSIRNIIQSRSKVVNHNECSKMMSNTGIGLSLSLEM